MPNENTEPSMSARADALEEQQLQALGDKVAVKSLFYYLSDGRRTISDKFGRVEGKKRLMGEDPRLPAMPEKPTLLDFFRYRFAPSQQHLLQSANLARKNGLPEKMILACLLHDIAVIGFIRADHGYWGAQLIEPYVDEEVSWAIRVHQALRFFSDESVGYAYPESYVRMFGEDFRPEPYIVAEYERAREHKWYMSARMICVNDLYAFDENVTVEFEEFEDIIGRNFKQPPEGLGNDATASSHMWRTLRRPCNAL
jgi:hypothetical protein